MLARLCCRARPSMVAGHTGAAVGSGPSSDERVGVLESNQFLLCGGVGSCGPSSRRSRARFLRTWLWRMVEGHDAGLNEAIINDTASGAPFNLDLISFLCCECI